MIFVSKGATKNSKVFCFFFLKKKAFLPFYDFVWALWMDRRVCAKWTIPVG
jgi:hypothetical protein